MAGLSPSHSPSLNDDGSTFAAGAPSRKRPLPSTFDNAQRLPPPAATSRTRNISCPISHLPPELALLILSHLPYRSLVALSRVDRYWRHLTFHQDGILWYRLSQKHGLLLPDRNTAAQHRWTLEDALARRPGLSRALHQSRRRLVSQDTLNTTAPTHLNTYTHAETVTKGGSHQLNPSARVWHGRVKTWRDYFETLIILEREWIEGKPTIKELRGHEDAVICVKLLPRRDRIVSGDRLGYLRVWCAVTGRELQKRKEHMMGIPCLVVHKDLLVSGSWDSTVIIWRQFQEDPYLKPLKIIDLGEQVMSMDLDANLDLAIGTVSGVVKIVSLKTFSFIDTFQTPQPHLCTAVSLHPDKVEATIGSNYYAWDRTTKAQVGFIGEAHSKSISCMKVDVAERLIFTGSQDGKVRIFSWGSKPVLLRQYAGHMNGVRCMTLQDYMVITGSSDKTVMVTFRDRHEYMPYRLFLDKVSGPEDVLETESNRIERIAGPVSFFHSTNVNCVDADTAMLVTGADDSIVRIFDFGQDLWRSPTPSSPRLCGQASLVSSASSTCVLMARPGRNKVSVGNRRQNWGTYALAVLTRARDLMDQSLGQSSSGSIPSLAWMNVDEIYQRMVDWELLPVSQGSTPKHTLNLALHMMAKSDPPTILLDSTVSPHRFALK
ncbi:WD40-repeat-containing domain protein [Gamsiella multidivaricata]|uniref:WD40-repeat-containing domain protein n=1 Tax=Gamsiella multidivaricata TaxID=101098 RepID=UPI00221FF1A5|nr:WD40-repeat-containing domain protein [Gamsiella multidivaricata]KAG0371176.1 hypothetical protein BGZ54_009535 [Gamsiella multidivaricata]KAI7823617.1 WD40-repeat-containing domain protein [Gamsiella multidivaricata]